MKARMWIVFAAGFLAGAFSMAQGAGAVSLQSIGNFNDPIYITSPPGDPRVFVVDRPGYIEVVHDGVTSQFLDIHGLTAESGERGLLSMAFDPNYAKNGLFYVFYTGTAAADGQEGLGHVDEFHVGSNPNVANLASRRPVLTITRPSATADNHNGGQLQFGSDGFLYVSVGDGGTGGSTAPNLGVLNGKILRIDPHGAALGAYSIPPGNPYVSSGTARHEIWASGFRNPWRFSFDRATGDLIVADVGERSWEEVDLAPAPSRLGRGANFGWPACEGFAGSCPGATPPVFTYPHSDPGGDAAFGCAIIGGYVYRGTQIPELAGRYLYADLCTGELRSIKLGIPFAGGDRAESAPGALTGPQSFGEDASCNLYVTNGNAVDRIVGSASGGSTCSAPPSVSGVSPADGAADVARSGVTYAVFTKAMDKSSAEAAFSLKRTSDGAAVSGSFGWYGPGVLIFKPDAALAPGTQYTATISTAAKDLAGNALADPVSWRFTSTASAGWNVTPTPNAAGPRTSLSGVDCSSANSCIAVGVVDDGSLNPGSFRPVVERWDGTSWQITTLSSFGSLNGISCPQPSVCFAVGSSFQGTPLIELWNGTSWSTQPSPPDVLGSLEDVSCSRLLACTAVGYARPDPNTFATLAERWDGSGWHLQSTPNPTGSDNSSLFRVSCPLKRTCTAVGQSQPSGDPTVSPVLERWFGRVNSWGLQAAPKPEGAESVGLGDVSCPDGQVVCVVVGSSTPSQGQSSVMAARRVGLGSWSIFPLITLPGSGLSTVDCPVVRFCQATGGWGSGLIAEHFDGASWQVEGIPTNGLPSPRLADVSCPSRFFCMAVGNTFNAGIGHTLAAKWTP